MIQKLQKLFIKHGITFATAESCTGGNIARLITLQSGSSGYFLGSVVSYSNDAKVNVLGVKEHDLKEFGAVSKQVAVQMASGVLMLTGANIAVSTTGIAGPMGGSVEKSVGTVWIGLSFKGLNFARRFLFEGSRNQIIDLASEKALEMVWEEVLKSVSISDKK